MKFHSTQEPKELNYDVNSFSLENLRNLIYRGLLDEAYQETLRILNDNNLSGKNRLKLNICQMSILHEKGEYEKGLKLTKKVKTGIQQSNDKLLEIDLNIYQTLTLLKITLSYCC